MGLRECSSCGAAVSSSAAACPHCGARSRSHQAALAGLVLVVGLFGLFLAKAYFATH